MQDWSKGDLLMVVGGSHVSGDPTKPQYARFKRYTKVRAWVTMLDDNLQSTGVDRCLERRSLQLIERGELLITESSANLNERDEISALTQAISDLSIRLSRMSTRLSILENSRLEEEFPQTVGTVISTTHSEDHLIEESPN